MFYSNLSSILHIKKECYDIVQESLVIESVYEVNSIYHPQQFSIETCSH